jgi:alanine racemase
VAIVNLGYADGYRRAMAGYGVARIGDMVCPVIGHISMDLVAIRIDGAAAEADWTTFECCLPDISAATGVSQYELLTGLSQRFARCWS